MSTKLRVAMALSVAGMILLPIFGLVIHFQPKFVHGLHANAATAERNCYIAAGCYGGLFIVCAIAHCVWRRKEKHRASAREAAAEKAIYGKHHASTKMTDDPSFRRDSRTSSREDTTIIVDSPADDHHSSTPH